MKQVKGEESHHRQKDRIGNDGGMQENVTCCFECLAHGKPGHEPKRGEIIKIIRTRVIS